MKRLVVYLADEAVGFLDQDDSGLLEFQYQQAWLERPDATALSHSLPLQAAPFRGKYARAFFAGILPEEEPRRRIAALLGISERNDFALLEQIGGECAGAISLLPEGITLPSANESDVRTLREEELQQLITDLPNKPLLAGEKGLRLSLAGAQNKLPIVFTGGTIALPLGNTPSTHIIKPEPSRFPGLLDNEYFCMTLASSIGLNVPPVEKRIIGGTACLIVQRYDRRFHNDGTVTRLHQEDFCQALGIPPEHKYQQEGGPLVRDCIQLLRDWSTTPVLDIREWIDGLIFNVLIGNADAHGKNYAMLYAQGQRRLAPFYDLICTLAWPELSTTPAMKIGGHASMDVFTPQPWQKMANESRLGWPMVSERIVALCEKTLHTIQTPSIRATGTDQLVTCVHQRASMLLLHFRPSYQR